MEIILSPSILSADFRVLGEQIRLCEEAGAKYLHIDVMDGTFVPNISFGFPILRSIRGHSDMVFDVHLMINEPERYITRFAEEGADIITFHAEATKKPFECVRLIRESGKRAGIAIKPDTDINELLPLINDLDMILCMTVEPGYGGQKYMSRVNEKISRLRALMPNVDIQIDGGVTLENIREPINAGANVIVAGTAVFSGDIKANIENLEKRMSGAEETVVCER